MYNWTMEKGEISVFSEIPKIFSEEFVPEKYRPREEDWITLQGGKPRLEILKPGVSFNVIHDYENKKDKSGTGVVVPTSINAVERDWGTNLISYKDINGRRVGFPVVLMWEKHGKPCEMGSNTPYRRIKISQ